MRKFIPLFVTVFLFNQYLTAQVPQGMNYQCVVRDATGTLVANSSVKIKFSVLPFIGGTVIYSEEHNLNTNQLGIITTIIGQGLPVVGQFNNIDWATGTKFLKLETDIGNTGTYTDAGTTQLVSVPYAMVANKSLQGIAHQTLNSYLFTTTQRGVDVFSNDSLVVTEGGTYLMCVTGQGYGLTYNQVVVPYGDNAVFLKIFNGVQEYASIPIHDYKKDDSNSPAYNLTPRQSSSITTVTFTAGNVIHPAVYISDFGTGGPNTNALGYSNIELTLVKLQ